MNWSWLVPNGKGIPVLMYHRVWPGKPDDLTITPDMLARQWEYLRQEGYQSLSLPQYLDIVTGIMPPPSKAVLVTFDDGYHNNLQYAYPLLRQMGFKATFFIIGNTLDVSDCQETDQISRKMSVDELKALDPNIVSLAMHGYNHENFGKISRSDIRSEVGQALAAFERSGLPYSKVWAYAYGARPNDMGDMKEILVNAGISAAFRIGNKISRIPAKNLYEIRRIDIKGKDTMDEFILKMKKGKLKPF